MAFTANTDVRFYRSLLYFCLDLNAKYVFFFVYQRQSSGDLYAVSGDGTISASTACIYRGHKRGWTTPHLSLVADTISNTVHNVLKLIQHMDLSGTYLNRTPVQPILGYYEYIFSYPDPFYFIYIVSPYYELRFW